MRAPNPDVPLFMADVFTFTLLSGTDPLLHQRRRDVQLQRQNVSRQFHSESTASNTKPRSGSKSTSSRSRSRRARPRPSPAARRFCRRCATAPSTAARSRATACSSRTGSAARDRLGDAVQGPARRHRRDRAHQRQAHGQFRPGAARHRHAAQHLSADLPAHALRFRLHAGQERLSVPTAPSGSGSTASVINWSGASLNYQQGTITFTSGVNAGVTATVGSVVGRHVADAALSAAERARRRATTFTVYHGCDHTPGTCQGEVQQPGEFSRLSLRAAAADGDLTMSKSADGQPLCSSSVGRKRAAVTAWSPRRDSWIGTPYHNCADIKGVGVDCGMLLVRCSSTPACRAVRSAALSARLASASRRRTLSRLRLRRAARSRRRSRAM